VAKAVQLSVSKTSINKNFLIRTPRSAFIAKWINFKSVFSTLLHLLLFWRGGGNRSAYRKPPWCATCQKTRPRLEHDCINACTIPWWRVNLFQGTIGVFLGSKLMTINDFREIHMWSIWQKTAQLKRFLEKVFFSPAFQWFFVLDQIFWLLLLGVSKYFIKNCCKKKYCPFIFFFFSVFIQYKYPLYKEDDALPCALFIIYILAAGEVCVHGPILCWLCEYCT